MIRKATPYDRDALVDMALLLWGHHDAAELRDELEALLSDKEAAIFIASDGENEIGFAQAQLRHDYVEGTHSSPVGYLEGIFVREAYRERGVARALVEACEAWAKEKGCAEFASDCELTNEQSRAFHLRVGFQEANRIICFTKQL